MPSFSHGYVQNCCCPSRPGVAEFQEHLLCLSWTVRVVTPQAERLVKTLAVQQQTSGTGWNQCPVLSTTALAH